ncbi:hypothetical protein CPPG_00199 [Cyanophage P-RSM1]|uniref:DUF6321 domain-containing protein n=1 Tax=Cyanophage P-RSM1 TaxID=536444 RepID=M4QR03_9CAUD|nr:hypothetical protein CPPG_00199 [Cyanophage P-RSM1]AGH26515.1 hypothetical protein CPPG_00199 [Cyanophage P-RSM1]
MKCAPATKGEKRYCRLCGKKETRKQCAYGGRMWDRYAVKDATEGEKQDAAEESGITNGSSEGGNGGMSEHWIDKFEKGILEANKSGDSSLRDWFSKSKSSDGKPGWVQLGGKFAGKPCAKQPGQTTKPKCGSSKMKRNLNKDEEEAAFRRKNAKDPNPDRKGKAINVKTEETQSEATYPSDFRNPDGSKRSVAKKKTGRPNAQGPESGKKDINEGEKDACYKKVKSRYSVWPSAYASGALVKCRKVGAKNWGNKSKKEEFEGLKSFSEFQAECWKTHKKVGMKMKGGKLVNDCRPKNEDVQVDEAKVDKGRSDYGKASIRNYRRMGPGHDDPGMFDPSGKRGKTIEKRREEHKARRGVKGAKVPAYNRESKVYWSSEALDDLENLQKKETTNVKEGAAWTKKSGKSDSGGLNEKGRKSYERENPGSDLKAPSKKVGNPRRASFCARMKGMKAKLTSKKTASDPDSRINKSLRAWNC